jgi:hypothetical protein
MDAILRFVANPVAQTFTQKCLQMRRYVVELVFRPHKPDRFTGRDRPIRGWEIDLASGAGGAATFYLVTRAREPALLSAVDAAPAPGSHRAR